MHCVKSALTIEETIKKSLFISVLAPCASFTAAHDKLEQLHQQYADASHIVYAYRFKTNKGLVCRFHDDGEPSGTAGRPVYQYLEGKNLINLLLAVVRYFGGVKLGAGGLARAYGNAAKAVIDAAELYKYIEYKYLQLMLDYKQLQSFEYQLKKLEGEIIEQVFSDKINQTIRLPIDRVAQLQPLLQKPASR